MFRMVRRRSKFDAGLCEDPDEFTGHAPATEGRDPIDARRELAVVLREIEAGNITERQATILAGAVDDVPQTEIAAQMNLAHQTVRNELATARRAARASWAAYAAAALFAALGLLIWCLRAPDRVAHPRPVTPDVPHLPDTPPAPTPHERAEALRRTALQQCDRQHWDDCLDGLDIARSLDPGGDDASPVQKARTDAMRHIRDRRPIPNKP